MTRTRRASVPGTSLMHFTRITRNPKLEQLMGNTAANPDGNVFTLSSLLPPFPRMSLGVGDAEDTLPRLLRAGKLS